MPLSVNSTKLTLVVLGGIVIAAGILLWASPSEQMLGTGVKIVYVHLTLIWTAIIGICVGGGLGIWVVLRAHTGLQKWSRSIGWVSLGFLIAGLVTSMIAAKVSWGAVYLDEPRYAAMGKVLAAAIVVQILNGWPIWIRLKGLLSMSLAIFLVWSMVIVPMVLHPANPVRTSPSIAIKGSVFGLLFLSVATAIWLVLYIRRD